jgi:hypothetical protein
VRDAHTTEKERGSTNNRRKHPSERDIRNDELDALDFFSLFFVCFFLFVFFFAVFRCRCVESVCGNVACVRTASAKGEEKNKGQAAQSSWHESTGRGAKQRTDAKSGLSRNREKKRGRERQRTQNRPKKDNRRAQMPQPAGQTQFGRIETKECLKSEREEERERETKRERERERVSKGGREKESVRESLSAV